MNAKQIGRTANVIVLGALPVAALGVPLVSQSKAHDVCEVISFSLGLASIILFVLKLFNEWNPRLREWSKQDPDTHQLIGIAVTLIFFRVYYLLTTHYHVVAELTIVFATLMVSFIVSLFTRSWKGLRELLHEEMPEIVSFAGLVWCAVIYLTPLGDHAPGIIVGVLAMCMLVSWGNHVAKQMANHEPDEMADEDSSKLD